jgi:hypothetical protein
MPMKTFQTEVEIAPGGVLVLRELPFAAGERVAVTVASSPLFSEMRLYAERMAEASADLIETHNQIAERLLEETVW